MAILAIAFLVLCVVCAAMESKVTGTYKAFGVYGRVSAYFSMFAPMGLGMFIASFFVPEFAAERWMMLILALVGAVFYVVAYLKCPDFLKKKLIISLLISGFGVCIKVCFFFIGAVWSLVGPQEMEDSDGRTVYVYDGEVYDGGGNHLGKVNPDRTSYTPNA